MQPIADDPFMRDLVLRADLRHPFAIHAILDNQQSAGLRHQSRQHGLDRGGAGRRQQHRGPFAPVQLIGGQQPFARLVLQIEEFAFAVAQIRLQQAAAHPLRQRDRPWVEQEHQCAPAAGVKCCISRVFTSTGVIDGRGRSPEVPARVSRRANRGPSSGGASSHSAIRSTSSVSSEEA